MRALAGIAFRRPAIRWIGSWGLPERQSRAGGRALAEARSRLLEERSEPVRVPHRPLSAGAHPARDYRPHTVGIAAYRGWTGLTNGQLIEQAIAEGFDVLLTVDQGVAFQQNLSGRALAVSLCRPGTAPGSRICSR